MEKFYDLIVNKFLTATGEYINSLDWSYMISLIILMQVLRWLFPNPTVTIGKYKICIPESWRVITIAFLLAFVFVIFQDQITKSLVKLYFQSMLASMVLYKLALGKIVDFISQYIPQIPKKDKGK